MELIDNIIELTKLSVSSSLEEDGEDYILSRKDAGLDERTMKRLSDEHARNTEKLQKEGKFITIKDFGIYK